MSGRHASEDTSFYRDLVIMIAGIIVVGGLVFGLLVLLADNPVEGAPPSTTTQTPGDSTSSSAPPTSNSSSTSVPESTSSTAEVPVREPSEVTVQVFNSIRVAGVAGRLTVELANAGYQTLQPDDYTPEQNPSRIWHRDGFSAEANVLLAYVPGAIVEPFPDDSFAPGADVAIIIGTGYEE